MWNSNPPTYPELDEEETATALLAARKVKGQQLYNQAYAKKVKGERVFPEFTAATFQEWIMKRGTAKGLDLEWDKPFALDADNTAVVKLLSLYFAKDPRFTQVAGQNYSFRKGILLIGPTGVGKSILMELCDTNPLACYTRNDCIEIAGEYAKKTGGQHIIDEYAMNTHVSNTDESFGQEVRGRFFDDLGQESLKRHYGDEANVMAEIIEKRYNAGRFYLTHFTSNHTIAEMANFYGPRVPDRLREMCNVIQFPASAKSRRI